MCNHSSDPHSYEIHVYTGLKSNSGTDSVITMIVAGSESDSGVRVLNDGIRKVIYNTTIFSAYIWMLKNKLAINNKP